MAKLSELVTRDDKLSSTKTIKMGVFAVMSVVLIVSVIFDRSYVPELTYALMTYGGGLTVSHGVITRK